MRVSIINGNLIAENAVGLSILEQYQFFRSRGNDVRIYTQCSPTGVKQEILNDTRTVMLADLLARREDHFTNSDLYIYHYPNRHSLMESIKTIEQGYVIFYYHNVTPANLWGTALDLDLLHAGYAGVPKLVPYADLIVTPSEFNAKQLVQEHGCEQEQIHLMPLTVPLDNFQPDTPDLALVEQHGLEDRKVILFVGRIVGNKRIDLLVEALPLIQAEVPDAILLLVGDGESSPAQKEIKDKISRRAEELDVTDDVIFAGIVEDLPPYYRLADVYATASLHEGFGIPLIEAMASGLPVVASDATAHPWVLDDAGLLCEPDDPKSLAQQVIQILTDQSLYNELVQRGLDRVQNFSAAASVERWTSLVEKITTSEAWQYQSPSTLFGETTTSNAIELETVDSEEKWFLDQIELLEGSANVMLHGYTVRSGLPIIGPIIAWIRRNLTSHLREPYLDPMLHRQEAFNRQLIDTLYMLEHKLNGPDRTQQRKFVVKENQRLQWMETQLGLLAMRLSVLESQQRVQPSEVGTEQNLLDDLEGRITELQKMVEQEKQGA